MKLLDTLPARLYLGKLSRLQHNPLKNPDVDWTSYKALEKVFIKNHPDHKTGVEEYMKEESRKWGKIFGEQFKLHSLCTYVTENLGMSFKKLVEENLL